MKRVIKVGSRESSLAMAQTNWVINEIKNKHPELEFEVIGINTKGDVLLDTRLDKLGGKGLFIKELENALLDGTIDLAVHSMKDMPAEIPEELTITAVSKREDPRDVLVTIDGKKLEELKPGAVIGTSSIRREIQLLKIRPDLEFKTLRGNVLTRLNKLLNNEYDALVLAAAGLKRLGLEGKITQCFEPDKVVPAVTQGILAIETRKNEDYNFILDSVHCKKAELASAAERAYMIKLNGGCTTPIAAHAAIEGDKMKVYGFLASPDGKKAVRDTIEGNKFEAATLGERLAEMILNKFKKLK